MNPFLKKGHRLSIYYNNKEKQIEIIGNKPGLEYLSEVCLSIIGKKGPSAHWHLLRSTNTITQDSIDTVIYFEEDKV